MTTATFNRLAVPRASIRSLLSAVAGGPRLEILRALAKSASDVGTLANELDLHIVTVSQHLGHLRRLGLVTMTTHGCRHVYRIADRLQVRLKGESLILHLRCGNGDRFALRTTE